MAIYNEINRIEKIADSWENKTGKEVEDFICKKLQQPIGETITYENQILTIYNSEGQPISQGAVTPVEPNYYTEVLFPQLIVNGTTHEGAIELNYNESTTFVAGVNIKTYYETIGNKYNISNKLDVIFYIDGTTEQLILEGITPNEYTDDSLQLLDITPLFQRNLQDATIKVRIEANGRQGEDTYKGTVTVHKIELSTSSTYVDNKTVVFNINNLSTTNNMSLEYFDVPLGEDPTKASKKTTPLTGTSSTDLVLETTGAHQIVARITNSDGSYYSNWVQANVVSYDSSNPESMMVIIGGIPTKITNCENANLYKIIYVPGLGGSAEIISYLSDESGIFSGSDWGESFNRTSLNTTSNDKAAVLDYYSYIELSEVKNSQKAIAFKLKIDNIEYPIYQLTVNNKGSLSVRNYFLITIQENPYNVNNAFNYTEGARDNFSQITGQTTSVFEGVSNDIELSDGWTTDENLLAYKISGQGKNLFTQPKDLSTLINSGQGFSIEVMLKNYNINGEDPVMNIGNLLFGPGFARVNSDDYDQEEGIYVNSRADFEKEVITHLMFVYDPAYKPNTYSDVYNHIFNEGGVSYSDLSHTYPILKIYVNGCINREIQIEPELLKNEDGFKLQICPSSSDLNIYIFRTYTRALKDYEIQKNFISSRTTSIEKKNIYDRNDILGSDGKISFYKTMLKHNVIVFVLPVGEKPLFFGNKDGAGDGNSKATILVRYKDEKYKSASGRLTGGKYKAQGSSAKKYMFHNTQYSKGMFLSEEQIAAGVTEGTKTYIIPTDPEEIAAKKLVGKVNYASSMQSHKRGSIKFYDRAYKENFGELYNGGKKACLEEPFVYFYYNVDDDSKLDTITIEDLYTTQTINNITVAQDSDVKFFGFQTWGSAKADDPTYGYDEDKTPEYVLFEGADNASPGANFKQPWAAFQTWDSTKTKKENQETTGAMIQQPKSVTETDHVTGLLIEGETIQFENDTDPLDVDYGVELLILDGQTEKEAEARDLWKFKDAVKNNSLSYFVEFYNNCYQYDFTNLIANPNSDPTKFDISNRYDSVDKRIYMTRSTTLYKGSDTVGTAGILDVFRWDDIKQCWVPAGLHYVNNNWETFNLHDVYYALKETELYKKYKDNLIIEDFDAPYIEGNADVQQYVIPAFKDMFKATVEEYCDKDDIAFHQAFIRLVSGTDNRAKNTYFQIIGKLYEQDPETDEWKKTETGDYKIRLMQDDLDTIFATDNNGQQVKPYYLLEPPFNKDTEGMWGDAHSAFFYPFDVCYYELINEYLGRLITHLLGSATSVKSVDTNLYDYFFSVQTQFPEIAYNHHAEIYYEMPQVLFYNGNILIENGQQVFPNTLSGFKNNSVQNPLSLSHGRCLESEYQFMKDRLLMLGTSTLTASGLYASDTVNLSTKGTGGDTEATTLIGTATYTDYFYPIRSTSESGTYYKIGNINSAEETSIKFDSVFENILPEPHIPTIIRQLVTPEKEFNVTSVINTVMGTYLNAASRYKTLNITQGLDYTHSLLTLPNAKSLVINGNTANYSITSSSITVKNFLPVIETLIITNTRFTNSVLDFRGCNRLETINLSGCTGIVDIIFPENNKLKEVYLPVGLKKLTLGKNPNLSKFVFAEGTKLTKLSLDCSSINENFDYIDLLSDKINYSDLEQFIITNTPENGLIITENIALKLANVVLSDADSLIQGKFIITDRTSTMDENNNITYAWGELTDISYNTKKYLVQAFGNIDSENNKVYFRYEITTLLRSTYKLPQKISVDVPSGGITIKPFEGLYFTTGNNVGITSEGRLNIKYSITGLPSTSSFNGDTGVLTVEANTNTFYSYSITVTLSDNTSLTPITGQIYLGYIEPAIGDYAYSDGTFSTSIIEDKTLVGLVYQKQTIIEGYEWKLGILSNKSINDYTGPDFYHYNTGNEAWSDNNNEQRAIYDFLTHSVGLGVSMTESDVNGYLGFERAQLLDINASELENGYVDYNYLSDPPSTLVKSGKDDTDKFINVGMNRLNTIVTKNSSLKQYLLNKGFINSQGEYTNNWTVDDFDDVYKEFNNTVTSLFNDVSEGHKVLHPLALKVSAFQPDNLSNQGLGYSKGNWYIPSYEEMKLLIWYRIRSTCTNTTSNSQAYWDSTEYTKGNSIFSDKYTSFDEFLNNSTKLVSSISPRGRNIVYSGKSFWNGNQQVTRYGWFYNYDTSWVTNESNLESCRRDYKYSISPCCIITVTKQS